MNNFHEGGWDRQSNGDGNGGDRCHSYVDMTDARDIRKTFGNCGEKRETQNQNGDHLVFDNPYKQQNEVKHHHGDRKHHGHNKHACHDQNTPETPTDSTPPQTPTTDTPPVTSIPPTTDTPPIVESPVTESPTPTAPGDNLPVPTTPADTPATNPGDGGFTPTVPNTTISELTKLSEQLLPVHANGSYPTTTQWEALHAANVYKAADAADKGSKIEFFGDSITEAMGYNPAAMAPFNQAFGADKPVAMGLGGDGSAQLLYRLNHGEMQGHPDTAVIMIGTNDIGSLSNQQIADNTQKSIESIQLRSPGTRVMVMGVLPRTESGDPGNTKVDQLNSVLSGLATANGAVQFANLRDSFVDANGNQKAELYADDKLHLSPAGYQAWATGLKAALNTTPIEVPTDNTNQPPIELPPTSSNGTAPLDYANIKGVNLSGAEWGKNNDQDAQFWPTTQELDYYKSKGMNTVRLMISWEQFQPTLNGPLNTAEVDRLHNFLQAADQRGMKVLVTPGGFARYTLNHGPNGQGSDGEVNGTLVGDPGVPVSAAQDFWSKLVKEVNTDPASSRGVGGWDLFNEPFDTHGTWPSTARALDQAIRATGDQHTIVVEGDQWARNFSGLEDLAKMDNNVVFEAHSYWDGGSGGYADQNYNGDANIGVKHVQDFVNWTKANNAKGFIGEWGVPTNNTAWAPAVETFVNYLEDNNMGNMVWAGGPGWGPGYTLSVEPINGQDRAIMSTIVEANQP